MAKAPMTPRDVEIDRILYEEWDPIRLRDVAPRDEYRSYVAVVAPLLDRSVDEIASALREIRMRRMGLRANDEDDRVIAMRLSVSTVVAVPQPPMDEASPSARAKRR